MTNSAQWGRVGENSTEVTLKPGLNYRKLKINSIKQMDNKLKGGDEAGDDVGKRKEEML